jgi:hypothetical protein
MWTKVIAALVLACIGGAAGGSADPVTEAYRAALEKGNSSDVYRAQSYLAPPFCYDLNRFHGITFTRTVNGRVVKPEYPFTYQEMDALKVRKLRDRADIDLMIRKSPTELELIQRISDWANTRFGHMLPLPYPTWDANEILDRVERGDTFFCTFKAVLFVQACNAAGLTASVLGINRKDQDAHTVARVYSNQFRKWILVDPWLNCYFERNGIPLSPLEFHDAFDNPEGIVLVFGEHGRGLEYWDMRAGKTTNIPHANARVPIGEDPSKGLIQYYYDIRIVMRNDHTTHPQSDQNINVDGFMVPRNTRGGEWWGPQLKWTDDHTPPQITCWNTGKADEFEWPLNEVEVRLAKKSLLGELEVLEARFFTFTPCFARYRLEIDGAETPLEGDVFLWRLKKGTNSLRVAALNTAGRSGFPSEFVIEYDPDKARMPAPVRVEIPNPGMEETGEKTPDGEFRPAKWWCQPPNAFGYKDFILDSKVKHAGKYSLRAAPARDPHTGVEYAFIIMTAAMDVNPGRDVVYSIWLRARDEGTPVDITLHDNSKWGNGVYVDRVTVGREWRKYELPCRLHNTLTNLYLGFKVWTGTVWADDLEYREMK